MRPYKNNGPTKAKGPIHKQRGSNLTLSINVKIVNHPLIQFLRGVK